MTQPYYQGPNFGGILTFSRAVVGRLSSPPSYVIRYPPQQKYGIWARSAHYNSRYPGRHFAGGGAERPPREIFLAGTPKRPRRAPRRGVRTTGLVGNRWYRGLSLRVYMMILECFNPFSAILDFLDFHIPPTPLFNFHLEIGVKLPKSACHFAKIPKIPLFFMKFWRPCTGA